jgi:hypothetical protein
MAMVVGDLINFSTVSEQADHQVLARDIDCLYRELRALLNQYRGTLVDYVGDAFFASWELDVDPAAADNALNFVLAASRRSGLPVLQNVRGPPPATAAPTAGDVARELAAEQHRPEKHEHAENSRATLGRRHRRRGDQGKEGGQLCRPTGRRHRQPAGTLIGWGDGSREVPLAIGGCFGDRCAPDREDNLTPRSASLAVGGGRLSRYDRGMSQHETL